MLRGIIINNYFFFKKDYYTNFLSIPTSCILNRYLINIRMYKLSHNNLIDTVQKTLIFIV